METRQFQNLTTAAGQFMHAATGPVSPNANGQLAIASAAPAAIRTLRSMRWRLFNAGDAGLCDQLDAGYCVSGEADGTAVDRITVNNATAGALYTVSVDLGTIVGSGEVGTASDASTQYAGFQVQVPALATGFTFDVRRPTGIGAGALKIRVEEVTGLKKGDLGQTYTLPAVRRYDFNGTGNDIQSGFTGVPRQHVVQREQRLRLDVDGVRVPAGNDGLLDQSCQCAAVPRRTLGLGGADVPGGGDGKYNDVRVYVGDRSFARNNIQVTIEGGGPAERGQRRPPMVSRGCHIGNFDGQRRAA
jgi:hypothetical protein